jgi:hypothetical protein
VRRRLTASLRTNEYTHGRVRDAGFWIRMRRRGDMHGPFETYVFGHFVDDGGQTRIMCTASLGHVMTAAALVWFSFVIVTLAKGLIATRPPVSFEPTVMLVFVPIALGAVGAMMVLSGRWPKRDDEAKLIHYLSRTLAVRQAPTPVN